MRNMRTKLIIATIALLAAVSYLAFAGLKDGFVHHMDVDAFRQNSQVQNQRVRLVGKVSADGFQADSAKLFASFNLAGKSETVPVTYRGAIPELFKADSEVVIEGRLDSAGVFQADTLMTKCASKYQSEEHAKQQSEAL